MAGEGELPSRRHGTALVHGGAAGREAMREDEVVPNPGAVVDCGALPTHSCILPSIPCL